MSSICLQARLALGRDALDSDHFVVVGAAEVVEGVVCRHEDASEGGTVDKRTLGIGRQALDLLQVACRVGLEG